MLKETKEEKLIKYVKLYSELKQAKKYILNSHIQKYESFCFFAKIKNRNKIFLPRRVRSLIKNSGSYFICLVSDYSLDFIHSEFNMKTPMELIDFFKENHEEVYCTKVRKTIKISKRAMEKLNLKPNDLVLILPYNSGFIIKNPENCDKSLL